MCNFSKYHEEVGRAEGRKEAKLSTTILNLRALMSTMNCSLEQALIYLKVNKDLRPAILNYFKENEEEKAII